jgi:hypothetical protein
VIRDRFTKKSTGNYLPDYGIVPNEQMRLDPDETFLAGYIFRIQKTIMQKLIVSRCQFHASASFYKMIVIHREES